MLLKYLKKYFLLLKFRKKWRKINKHNLIVAKNLFNDKIVKVGKYSYGALEIYGFGDPFESLQIGSFVSIAEGVKFILGGNHKLDNLTTYPFDVNVLEKSREATTKGGIFVEDDVWIGFDSIILSGVRIGKGSVIAARSVVVKDVPPYAIVGGNPAKLIRYRFSRDIVDELLKVDLNKIDDEFIRKNRDLLYTQLNQDILVVLKSKLEL